MIQTREMAPAASKGLAFGFVLAALVATMLLAARPANAATFTVNTTGDTGDSTPDGTCGNCTLRQAIQEANASPGADTINFNIPDSFGEGVKIISPASELPAITEAVTIDGYTQPGASENTLTTGTNAVLLIEIDGSRTGQFFVPGLKIEASNVVVKGLVINRFRSIAITIGGNDTQGNRVEGNFIGTDPSGTLDFGNGGDGVRISGGSNNSIGGATPAARNLVSGNNEFGVFLASPGNRVEGNLIGTSKDGTSPLGNGGAGVIFISSSNNSLGGSGDAANTIAFNAQDGVVVIGGSLPSTANRILGNSIFSNGGLGIDLLGPNEGSGSDVRTPNDFGDFDTGPNNLQNFPVLTSARTAPGGSTIVEGTLRSAPEETYTLRFFSNPPNTDEGKTFVGERSVTTNVDGVASFIFAAGALPVGAALTATATDAAGNTSEFSLPATVTAAPLATDDSYTLNEDRPLFVPDGSTDILANDSDADGDLLTARIASPPGHGTLTLRANGSFTYKPDPNFNGEDYFTYKVSDGTSRSNPATVKLTVRPVNDAPTITSFSPKPGSEIRDRTPTIRATVRDIETDLSKTGIELFIDGQPKAAFSYDRETDRLSFVSEELSFGTHTVKIVATDAQGKRMTQSWSFRVVH